MNKIEKFRCLLTYASAMVVKLIVVNNKTGFKTIFIIVFHANFKSNKFLVTSLCVGSFNKFKKINIESK